MSRSNQKRTEIPEEEQWRLINQSGVLDLPLKSPEFRKLTDVGSQQHQSLADEILDAFLFIIPFSFLLLTFEILIHNQYGKQPSVQVLVDRMLPSVPILSIFIFYTCRYKHHRRMQFLLFLLSVAVGTRMVYLLKRGSWLANLKQCPPLATVWVYTIIQLNLGPAVLNLIVVWAWMWWKKIYLFS